jgi:Arc/MetJ-type ribon-helix-helix transcriptional regulator
MSTKERLSASVDVDLLALAHEAVSQGRAESVSAWVNDALHLKAEQDRRLAAVDEFLEAFESEHGEITEREMHEAARRARARAVVVRGRQGAGAGGGPARASDA